MPRGSNPGAPHGGRQQGPRRGRPDFAAGSGGQPPSRGTGNTRASGSGAPHGRNPADHGGVPTTSGPHRRNPGAGRLPRPAAGPGAAPPATDAAQHGHTGLPHRTTAGVQQRRVGASQRPATAGPRRPTTGARPHRNGEYYDDDLADVDTVVFATGHRRAGSLGAALLITLGAALLPGSGHLVLRRRVGWAIVAAFVLALAAAGAFVTRVPRAQLVEYVLTPDLLLVVILGCFTAAVLWLATILRTYELAKPAGLGTGRQVTGAVLVFALCLLVSAPFAIAGYTANAQRNLVNALFPSGDGGGSKAPAGDAEAIKKPRINILLLGSDAGEGRIGARTDTMVVASIDTKTGRTVLFSLPRNTAFAQFPPGSKAAKQFPNGFHNPAEPAGNYLLNAVYAYGAEHQDLAPPGPSRDPGLNLLTSSISHMLGLSLDYYIVINMQGFTAMVDALGGLDVNVGPQPVPMGGIGPFGEVVRPFGWIPAGQQHLDGLQALWFARSRTNSTDYIRMGRQRCIMQYLVAQKSPIDVLKNFQSVSTAATESLSTNIPQEVLPALVTLAGKAKAHPLESVAFDPGLPDPEQADGRFNTGDPNFALIRTVVRNAIAAQAPTAAPAAATPSAAAAPTTTRGGTATKPRTPTTSATEAALPVSLDEACNGTAAG